MEFGTSQQILAIIMLIAYSIIFTERINRAIVAISAAIVVVGIAARNNQHIGFFKFMIWGVPVTIVTTYSFMYIFTFYV